MYMEKLIFNHFLISFSQVAKKPDDLWPSVRSHCRLIFLKGQGDGLFKG